MSLPLELLQVTQSLIFIFGCVVVFYAWRAFARDRSAAMLSLALGFGFVTLGAVAAGILFQVSDMSLIDVVLAQAIFQAAGFAIIVYSLVVAKS